MIKKYYPLLLVLLSTILLYAIHKSAVVFSGWKELFSGFHYSLEMLYLAFGLASLLIVFLLIKVKERNFDQIGLAFMALITIKMFVFYFVFRPVISSKASETDWERVNFIVLFMTFLILETVVSAQILKSSERK